MSYCSHVSALICLVFTFRLCHYVYMYVAAVPNRSSPPAILLRESFRENGKVRNRTLANISHWPAAQVAALREVLKGATAVGSTDDSFQILRSLPHGHVAAVIGSLRELGLDRIIDSQSSRPRDLTIAMIAARLIDPCSKLATARALHPDTLSSSLSAYLGTFRLKIKGVGPLF